MFNYHQVFEDNDELRAGEPTRQQFASDLSVLASNFNVLPYSEAVQGLEDGSLPPCAACISFDDGYLNNLEVASEELSKQGMSAIFFIATAKLDLGIMWNDIIIEAVRRSTNNELKHDFASCGVFNLTKQDKLTRISEILSFLKYQELSERRELALRFFEDNTREELPRLMMTREQVNVLAKKGFEIGCHTVNHPILAKLSKDEAEDEIRGSKDQVAEIIGDQPSHFAYPNGIPGKDFTDRDAQLVKRAGFDSAVSTYWGIANSRTDKYSIPRIGPWWRQGAGVRSGQLRSLFKSYLV